MSRPGRKRRTWFLVVVVIGQFAVALFPFEFDPPRTVANDVRFAADGTLTTGTHNRARTVTAPLWLGEVIDGGSASLLLVVRTSVARQSGPARIFTVSGGFFHANLTVAQDRDDLIVRINRTGSTPVGEPAMGAADVFAVPGWHEIGLAATSREAVLSVDGQLRDTLALEPGPFAAWSPRFRLAIGDEPDGGRPWVGIVRRAEVRTPSGVVDYLKPGALDVPPVFRYVPHRVWGPVRLPTAPDVVVGLLHATLFVPFGFALRRARRHPPSHLVVVGAAAAVALTIQLAKTLFAARHPALVDVAWHALGAGCGSALAMLLSPAGGARRR